MEQKTTEKNRKKNNIDRGEEKKQKKINLPNE
jgi:hypothetical protein